MAGSQKVDVGIETTAKRAFASALDWPGWCRSGRDEDAALAALAEHGQRFAAVAAAAGVPFAAGGSLVVVERAPGTATTQFGAPDVTAAADRRPLTAAQARRIGALVAGSWRVFDDVVAHAPVSLRKGPRGGGRDRDAIVEHVLSAQNAYARKIGLRSRQPQPADRPAIDEARRAVLAVLEAARQGAPLVDRGWVPRYAARRIAWHVLDHAWEIEDKSER